MFLLYISPTETTTTITRGHIEHAHHISYIVVVFVVVGIQLLKYTRSKKKSVGTAHKLKPKSNAMKNK